MNLGRFHAAIHALREEFEQDNIIQLLTRVQTTLQQSIGTPNESTAQVFKDSYAQLVAALDKAKSNTTFPTRQKIFVEIGAVEYIGMGLARRIEALFLENQITPANAYAELQKLTQQIDQFSKRIKIIEDAFTALKLECEELEPGQFEIGLSLPRGVIGSDIESLENEFHEANFALKTIQEVVGEGAGGISVKTISASEWQIYLDTVPKLAAGLAFAVERIVALYKNNLEIKKIKKELEDKKLPDSVLKPLQEHIETTIRSEIRKIAEELVDKFYKKKDEGRENELKTKTSKALRYLADRIDRGATIEVHAEPPRESAEAVEGEDKEKQEASKKASEVKELAKYVNERMASTARLVRSDQPVLAIDYDKNEKK